MNFHFNKMDKGLRSLPQPGMNPTKRKEIYQTLLQLEQSGRPFFNKRMWLHRVQTAAVSVSALLLVSLIGLSYINYDAGTEQTPASQTSQPGTETPWLQAADMSEEVATYGMTYQIESVERTKEKGPLPIDRILQLRENGGIVPMSTLYDAIVFDQEGNILNDYSYLIVQLSIEEDLGQEHVIPLNNYYLVTKDAHGEYVDKFEPQLYDKRSDVEKRDYFMYPLKPNEKNTFQLGFIFPDEVLNQYQGRIDFVINNSGMMEVDDENVRVIPLEF